MSEGSKGFRAEGEPFDEEVPDESEQSVPEEGTTPEFDAGVGDEEKKEPDLESTAAVTPTPEVKKTAEYTREEIAAAIRSHFERMELRQQEEERLEKLLKALMEKLDSQQQEILKALLQNQVRELRSQGRRLSAIVDSLISTLEPILKAVESKK